MCNYPESFLKGTQNIFVPGNSDRKSMLMTVTDFDITEKQFELILTEKRSYVIDESSVTMYIPGDILNLIEFNKSSNENTGRILKSQVVGVQCIDIGISIISFKLIKG